MNNAKKGIIEMEDNTSTLSQGREGFDKYIKSPPKEGRCGKEEANVETIFSQI
jgi:hypothetical protein